MKKILLLGSVGATAFTAVHADNTVDCSSSILPVGFCNSVAGVFSGGFTITTFIGILVGLVIAAAVIFIFFQVIKAIFEWLGKSSDDKAKQAAIKSITNAVIAGVVLVVALIIFAILLPAITNVPAAYSCYAQTGASYNPETGTAKAGTSLPGTTAYDGTPAKNGTNKSGSSVTGFDALKANNSDLANTITQKIVCKDDSTGNETTRPYVVVKSVGIQKAPATPAQ